MNCAVVVQTCDKYSRFWDGFFRFMSKHWDPAIDAQIFFCNEECRPELPRGFHHMPTGRGSFTQNLRYVLNRVGQENVFYMLEDFWPIAPMGSTLFDGMFRSFSELDLDAYQVSSYLPYYSLEVTDESCVFRFKRDSDWIFNFQARFWKTEVFSRFLTEPEISESEVGSAITVEMASDRATREAGGISAMLRHYLWYPISGVSYRGELTDIGRQMQNDAGIDRMVEGMFSGRSSTPCTPP